MISGGLAVDKSTMEIQKKTKETLLVGNKSVVLARVLNYFLF